MIVICHPVYSKKLAVIAVERFNGMEVKYSERAVRQIKKISKGG